jgi:hypothetical protein
MVAVYVLSGLVVVGLLFGVAVQIAESIPKIRLRMFTRSLTKRSQGELAELALRLNKDRSFADAVAAQISDSDALLQIGRDAQNDSMKAAAKARHCLLFGHRLNDKCICSVCRQEAHDFRDEKGRTPAETSDFGEFACTHCPAVFSREYVPGCKDTCTFMECCCGDGEIPRFSSLSGEGGCWYETCERYVPSEIRESVRNSQ